MTQTYDQQPRYTEYMPLATLMGMRDPSNVKGHAEDAIDASLERFGYIEPVVVDERTGRLVSGHGRVERLALRKEVNQRPPDGVIVVGDDWELPVARGWASANDTEAQAAGVALNRIGEIGGWTDGLATLLADLAATDAGMPPGFTADDLDQLLADLGAGELPDQGTDADHADDLSGRGDPAAPRQQQGLNEVGLMFQADHHAEFLALLAQLRQLWGADMATPMIVLRALRLALDAG